MGSRKKATAPKIDTAPVAAPVDVTLPGEGLGLLLNKRELANAIKKFQTIVDRKSTMPILANVSLRTDATGITITGTDLDVSLRVRIDASNVRAGAVSVAAKRLAEMIKTLPDGDVTLYQTTRTNLILTSGAATLTLEGIHDRDTPSFPSLGKDAEEYATKPWPTMSGETLKGMIDRVKHSVCLDETRFHLNGIFFESTGVVARMITTDGHRLAKCEAPIGSETSGTPLSKGVILRRKACLELGKHYADGPCDVLITKTHAWFRQGGMTLVTKLIDAQFPPYEQVIPKDHRRIVTVDRTALVAAITRAKVNCTDYRGAKLSLASGKLTIEASDPDSGTITECLDVDYTGTECSIGVNARYLIDTLGQITDATVVLALGTEAKRAAKGEGILDPMLVRSLDDAAMRPVMAASFLSVVMPMRV